MKRPLTQPQTPAAICEPCVSTHACRLIFSPAISVTIIRLSTSGNKMVHDLGTVFLALFLYFFFLFRHTVFDTCNIQDICAFGMRVCCIMMMMITMVDGYGWPHGCFFSHAAHDALHWCWLAILIKRYYVSSKMAFSLFDVIKESCNSAERNAWHRI